MRFVHRIQYTNGLMFLFIEFLENEKINNKLSNHNIYYNEYYAEQNNNVRYYTIKRILNSLLIINIFQKIVKFFLKLIFLY